MRERSGGPSPISGWTRPSRSCDRRTGMHTVYVDAGHDEQDRLARLYSGELLVFTPRPSTLALVDFAREMIAEAFAPHDPLEAQYAMAVEEWVARFGPV